MSKCATWYALHEVKDGGYDEVTTDQSNLSGNEKRFQWSGQIFWRGDRERYI